MVGIERIKELLADAKISDQEAESIRDSFRDFAEIIFIQLQQKNNNKNYGKCSHGS